jgi:hypothetical protein
MATRRRCCPTRGLRAKAALGRRRWACERSGARC